MKKISIQDLKASLSAAITEAAAGNTIVITKHNEPFATLGPAYSDHVHRGKDLGRGGLRPAIKRGSRIPYLNVLLEDRGDR